MFITPAQRIGAIQEQQSRMYGRDLTAAQVAAAPSPMQQAAQTAFTGFGGTVGGALTQYGLSKALMQDYSAMSGRMPQIEAPNLMAPPPSLTAPSVGFGGTP